MIADGDVGRTNTGALADCSTGDVSIVQIFARSTLFVDFILKKLSMDKETSSQAVSDPALKEPITRENELLRDNFELGDHPVSKEEPLKDRLWLFEVFSWLLCTLGLVAIAIILSVTQDKPVPSWTAHNRHTGVKFTVTINSVISLFSTLVKSTLLIPVVASLHQLKWIWFKDERPLAHIKMFEGAGKGPLGSVILIWTLRGRALACLGAFIVIASLGVDFTLQQLVTYPLRPAERGSAAVARSNAYSGVRPGALTGTPAVELPMLTAAYRGAYNFNATDLFLPTPNCSTGNCTWPEIYTSIGVCGVCNDITTLLNVSCSTYNYETIETDENGNITGRTVVGAPIPYCNFTLPGGQGISGNLQYPITLQVNDSAAGGDSYFSNGMSAHFTSFTIIRATPTNMQDSVNDTTRQWYNFTNVNATECGFDVCVKKYASSMNNTIFTETILDTFTNTTDLSISDAQGTVKSVIIQPQSTWTNHSDAKDANIFEIDPLTMIGLRFMFAPSSSNSFWDGAAYDDGAGHVSADSDIVSYLSNLDNNGTSGMIDSIAAAMTKRMREAPGNEAVGLGSEATGILSQDVPYVNVRWGWISFPASLVFLAFLFLVMTIFENTRKGAMLWKSNSLANFYHPLTKDGRDTLQTGQNAAEAEEIAEKMQVQWRKTEAGYRLVQRHE
ncbi:uncharacterized protein PV09_08096 [Verruconis gallopava]|uniref:Uncharacterized protein n=1 Tax=Verruconis gallopava TaxID=253628 RepID=A0A0D1YHP9_9PEZI|nr:uncharacterized protein PV09_08096 [Verruconis gallopava]KIW00387.1 hypothetical protein PV09_08096 [Verruconis gallopava]